MTNYLTVNDFKSADLQKACRRADKNNSGGIDTDSEFKNLINSIHTNNPQNYCPQGHIYEGTESEINLVHEAYDKYKNDKINNFVKEYKDFIEKNSDLGKQIGRVTNEFRPEVDGKYEPVYSEPDPLGRKEVIGYQPKNSFDIWY